jgi:hypothetical protein
MSRALPAYQKGVILTAIGSNLERRKHLDLSEEKTEIL